jgi:hypothetical protein
VPHLHRGARDSRSGRSGPDFSRVSDVPGLGWNLALPCSRRRLTPIRKS